MSNEFTPLVVKSTWADHTAKGFEIVHLNGPDIEGNWAAVVKDSQGRVAGFSYDKYGQCVGGLSDYNLVSFEIRYKVVYANFVIGPLGLPEIYAAQTEKFKSANIALVFDRNKLVGSKVL